MSFIFNTDIRNVNVYLPSKRGYWGYTGDAAAYCAEQQNRFGGNIKKEELESLLIFYAQFSSFVVAHHHDISKNFDKVTIKTPACTYELTKEGKRWRVRRLSIPNTFEQVVFLLKKNTPYWVDQGKFSSFEAVANKFGDLKEALKNRRSPERIVNEVDKPFANAAELELLEKHLKNKGYTKAIYDMSMSFIYETYKDNSMSKKERYDLIKYQLDAYTRKVVAPRTKLERTYQINYDNFVAQVLAKLKEHK